MEAFTILTAIAAPLALANVDTDQIIPARFLKKPRAGGYQSFLFHDLRRLADDRADEDFVLNRPEFQTARILVAGPNFGCGSSREGAVYALVDAGIRAVIAAGFGDIFYGNALKNGLLPITLDAAMVEGLWRDIAVAPALPMTIDLLTQQIRRGDLTLTFAIDPFRRDCLLQGIDEIDLTLESRDCIEAFRAAAWRDQPWTGLPDL